MDKTVSQNPGGRGSKKPFFVSCSRPFVVNFDQRLGAAHAKCRSKQSFSVFFLQKSLKTQKSKKFTAKFCKKKQFFLGIKQLTSVLVQISKTCFFRILLQISCFFGVLQLKMLKMTISTSVWHAQQPNAGQNIQQPLKCKF